MSDLIDRQQAIDALYHVDEYNGRSVEAIRNLPSAQPYTDEEIQKMQDLEQAELDKAFELGKEEGRKEAQPEQRWIPCCETVDIPDHDIMACDKYGEMMFGYLVYEDDQWLCASDGSVMCDQIAWCELPEPYRKEGEE